MTSHVVSAKTEPRRNPEKKRPPSNQARRRGTPGFHLTDRELHRLGPGEHADGKIPGLVFRVRPTGGRSWALLYWARGRRRRLTLGSYPALGLADARSAARSAKKAVNLGADPAAERRESREAGTFGELAERYIAKWAKPRKRTWAGDVRMLNRHVLSRWKHLPAAEIRRRDVRDLLEKVSESGSTAANRVRSLLSKIMNYGISLDVVEVNPVLGTLRNPEHARDRVLTEDEIRTLWRATEDLPPAMSARIRLPLVTAQRGGEVNGMKWSDLDLGSGVWTIPAAGSKNKLPHRVPLSPLALELLEQIPREDAYVLSGARGTRQLREAMAKIAIEDWRGHDVRRTAASYMASIGIPRLTIGKVLNHVESGVTAVYDRHGYDLEKRDALNRWAAKLRSILAHEKATVVDFRR